MADSYQATFQRIEIKYLLSEWQYRALRDRLREIAEVDAYGKTSILNIYYDTPEYLLIRRSLEKPVFKEKLRLRTYGVPGDASPAYVEIKRKYSGVVYKRRVGMHYDEALSLLSDRAGAGRGADCRIAVSKAEADAGTDSTYITNGVGGIRGATGMSTADNAGGSTEPAKAREDAQILREIEYFRSLYAGLCPMMEISYDRIAMAGIQDPALRITFDEHIRYRTTRLDLRAGNSGRELLAPGQRLMEIKVAGAIPLALAHLFAELEIVPCSFSKYGQGYVDLMKQRFVTHNRIAA